MTEFFQMIQWCKPNLENYLNNNKKKYSALCLPSATLGLSWPFTGVHGIELTLQVPKSLYWFVKLKLADVLRARFVRWEVSDTLMHKYGEWIPFLWMITIMSTIHSLMAICQKLVQPFIDMIPFSPPQIPSIFKMKTTAT